MRKSLLSRAWGSALALALIPAAVLLAVPIAAQAEACPNEQVRRLEAYAARLPDCRAYEQVTPVNKDGGQAQGAIGLEASSPAGDRITWLSDSGLPGQQGASDFPLQLSSRASGGWSTQGLLPPSPPGAFNDIVLGWSADLAKVFDSIGGSSDQSNVGLTQLDTVTSGFTPMFSGSGDFADSYSLDGASADHSHVIFEDNGGQLTADAAAGADNLYQWDSNGTLSLVGRVPASPATSCNDTTPGPACVTPASGSFAGPYNWQSGDTTTGGGTGYYFTQNTISADGSRVFFTAGGTGQLYVRENGTRTVQVSASQRTVPDPNGSEPAAFMAATPDGSHVFFTSCQKLTNDSTAVSTASNDCLSGSQGQDLYVYDLDTGTLTDLTVDSNVGDALGAAVQGVLGASNDGNYVYFAANGVLASGATPGSCQGTHETAGTCSVYLWHDGTVRFIASLGGANDPINDWAGSPTSSANIERASRVSADGRVLLFASTQRLTGYDNLPGDPGACDPNHRPTGARCQELYRYDATTGQLGCVSCDPTGAAPTGNATLQDIGVTAAPLSPAPFLTRNLSADGSRVFFESVDALVPQDTNGDAGCAPAFAGARSCQDVYEWEADGAGSCHSSAENGGCLYLISSGKSPDPSFFADASADGNDVFVYTSDRLVGQDQDQAVDIYDARVNGGLASQNPSSTAPCSGEGCKPPPGLAPTPVTAASVTFSGPGNSSPAVPAGNASVLSRVVHGTSFFVRVRVPAAGRITITANGIRPISRRVDKAGIYRLRVTLTDNTKKVLKRKRKLTLKLRVGYAPDGGGTSAATVSLTVERALRHGRRHARRARAASPNYGGAR